ncbi:hypothetical protein D0Y65_013657 [Glycine soja]|uniref:Uncharacterized protein n=1 Tax=Glycine soja TaxID=3848 RepID=A0A445K472_GLYSO|nr:hypothetical protein D0Y65_013657 [Glycine soja]
MYLMDGPRHQEIHKICFCLASQLDKLVKDQKAGEGSKWSYRLYMSNCMGFWSLTLDFYCRLIRKIEMLEIFCNH